MGQSLIEMLLCLRSMGWVHISSQEKGPKSALTSSFNQKKNFEP